MFYVSLHSGPPKDGGVEASYTGYQRVPVNPSEGDQSLEVSFPEIEGWSNHQILTHIVIGPTKIGPIRDSVVLSLSVPCVVSSGVAINVTLLGSMECVFSLVPPEVY